MKHLTILLLLIMTVCLPRIVLANAADMQMTLQRVNHLLNRINPLINQAQRQQDPNARVQFQFEELRLDIRKIQAGIQQALQATTIQPRTVTPLSGDYVPISEATSLPARPEGLRSSRLEGQEPNA